MVSDRLCCLVRLDLWSCVCVDNMLKGTTTFEILKFDGKNIVTWKVKIYAILVKDGCTFALKGKNLKPAGMKNAQFNEKDRIAKIYLFFILKNKILFNVQTMDTIAKALWESLHKVYEDMSLVNNRWRMRFLFMSTWTS